MKMDYLLLNHIGENAKPVVIQFNPNNGELLFEKQIDELNSQVVYLQPIDNNKLQEDQDYLSK